MKPAPTIGAAAVLLYMTGFGSLLLTGPSIANSVGSLLGMNPADPRGADRRWADQGRLGNAPLTASCRGGVATRERIQRAVAAEPSNARRPPQGLVGIGFERR